MNRFQTLILLCFSQIICAQSWQVTQLSPMPMPISNNAVVQATVGGTPHLFSFAGIDSTKKYSGITLKSFRYNIQTDSWDSIAALPDTMGKIAAGASVVNNKIYIIGGYYVFSDGDEKSSDHVHIYDPDNNQYLADGAAIPVPIDDQVQAVYRDSLIYVITGWSNTTNRTNVQIYDPALDTWYTGTPVPNTNNFKSFGASGTIVGDTIYYFGGATAVRNFPIQNVLRIGIIDPTDPTNISWRDTILNPIIRGYRMAVTQVNGNIHWIGGSNLTYNYDGLAYVNGSGVEPNNRNLVLDPGSLSFSSDTSQGVPYPMDLRGIGESSSTVRYLAGGMETGQKVSNRTLRLSYLTQQVSLEEEDRSRALFTIFPNPSDDKVFLEIDEGSGYRILELNGRTLQTGIYLDAGIDVADLKDGIYLLEVRVGEQWLSQKLRVGN